MPSLNPKNEGMVRSTRNSQASQASQPTTSTANKRATTKNRFLPVFSPVAIPIEQAQTLENQKQEQAEKALFFEHTWEEDNTMLHGHESIFKDPNTRENHDVMVADLQRIESHSVDPENPFQSLYEIWVGKIKEGLAIYKTRVDLERMEAVSDPVVLIYIRI